MATNSKQQGTQSPALPKGFTTKTGVEVSIVKNANGYSVLLVQKVKVASNSKNPLMRLNGMEQRRSCFLKVPSTMTPEDAIKALKADKEFCSTACIGRILSLEPIITDDLQYAIDEGFITLDDVVERQLVKRYDSSGNLCPALWHGQEYYALDVFMGEDEDLRS